ncbi:alpha-2-macroglobulin family protein [Nannocystis sp.]|uniref:alpha-2-macroglobulin n=1 Tax=Nannocystis sp. TaxID=1962667 RepID=UPI0025E2C606|nr:alpha-2-macroglobulin family protein [Nannocystis sp.]
MRHSPDGEVPVAADLSVTFSQPMVAVTSLAQLAAAEVPVRLSPATPGSWQWLGTRTLVFRPTTRFPMATEFRVEVPAGVAAADGSKLSQGTAFTFATPPARLLSSYPRDTTTTRAPRIFLAFDQRIDPAAVLPSIQVTPAGGSPAALRLVPRDEAVKDRELRGLIESAEDGRWLIVQPTAALPGDVDVRVTLAVGLPSAEGPRKTVTAQDFSFHTYGPLNLTLAECGWGSECDPGVPFRLGFSNPLDDRRFKKEWVKVEPEVPGLTVSVSGNELYIQGATKARTKYTVTVDPALRDAYGQRLGRSETRSFTVGPAPDNLYAPLEMLTVLDPAAAGKVSVFTTGHKSLRVRIYAVTPSDWDAYLAFQRAHNEDRLTKVAPPGKQVFNDKVKIDGDPDILTETAIDLRSALPGGLGHAIVLVEPTKEPKEPWMRREVITWAQSTRIGLDAFVDGEKMVAFATRLVDGAPQANVALELSPSGAKASSGADGLASFALPAKSNRVLLATQGEDRAFLPQAVGWWYGDNDDAGWKPYKRGDTLHWFVFDDRQMYRPGETIKIKGWLRTRSPGLRGGLGLPAGAASELRYSLVDSQGNKLLAGTVKPNALGGFDLGLTLPKTPNLGDAYLNLEVASGTMKDQSYSHHLQIQEFRRPEYEVKASAGEGPHLVGGHADLTVSAQYFAGGPLANAEVHWSVTSSPGSYHPPGHDDFTFGRWVPWWDFFSRFDGGHSSNYRPPQEFTAHTDAAGEHHLRADFIKVTPIQATSLHAEASVVDVNRQSWTSSTDLLVHPANLYVGMKSQRLFVQKGEPLDVDSIITDLDGKLQPGRDINVRAVRVAYEQEAGEWKETEKDPQDCKKGSAATPVRCSFIPKEGGTYRVTASIADDQGRRNESQLTLWVAGGDQPPSRGVEQEQVQLIPDKKEYATGESAKLLVLAPFAPSEGVLTLRREGIVETRRVSLAATSTTIEVPIDDAHAPALELQLDLVGSAPRNQDNGQPDPKLPRRPAFAAGHITLAVPPRSRTLNLSLKPGVDKLEPGGSTSLEVLVLDAKNQPVRGSEVAVVVVDEAVLALSNYQLADPLAAFFPALDAGVSDHHSRASIVLANPEDAAQDKSGAGTLDAKNAPGGGAATTGVPMPESAPAPAPPPAPPSEPMADNASMTRASAGAKHATAPGPAIALRSNFDALALFAAALPTDAQGRARVDIKLPDNLTRYRIMAVAVAGADRFGKAESAITARLPLMVRPSAPRFLNFGDRFELPIVLQNQTDAPLTVDLAARTANLDLTQGAGRKVTVPANDRVEVRLPAAAVKAGTARFQVVAASGKWSDAASGALPVWTPATTEAFATYGQIDNGAISQPVLPPQDAVPSFGGLELSTSSTALAELTDAVLYLVRYPFECSEQLSSRMITIAALKDVLSAFKAESMPSQAELLAFVQTDIERLSRLQNPDGGWSFWRRGEPSWPYLTIHVAHALERARSKGFPVPPATLDRAQDYLKDIESKFESWYMPEIKRPIIAYALYTRARLGVRDTARARTLYSEVALDKHSLETLGWLLPVLGDGGESKAILRHLQNQVRETAGAAHFTTSYSDGAHLILHSERRVDGVLLEALIGADPNSDLIPKLVRGLLAHRVAGRWNNTQENAFVLLALDRYFNTYEKVTPDFLARAWLGPKSAGEHRFKGRTTEQSRTFVAMPDLLKAGAADLVLSKDGPGRLYYRLGLRYAPKDLKLPALERGFVVERKYEALDDPKDVRRDPDGTWHIRAGARVKVALSMVAQDRRYHVALVDPLPAGLEAINPALATTGNMDTAGASTGDDASPMKRGWWWWWRPWYDHQNLRDERVEAFTTLLWDGVHDYSYTARATTPGTFVVPPAKAEEMYAPETFGRSASDRVIVE